MSDELRRSDRTVARALREVRDHVAGLGPSDTQILAAEVAALRRSPSRAGAGAWAAEVERVRATLEDAGATARRVEHQRHAARRAAWARSVGAAGRRFTGLPAPAADPRSAGSRLLRHGWLAGLAVGALLVGDGLATIVWQEPLSALYTRQKQDRLDAQLPSLIGEFGSVVRGRVPDFAAAADRLAARVRPGGAVGRIALPSLGSGFVIVQGTSTANLELGPGHYTGTALPGQAGTVGIAGHRTTYLAPFRGLDGLRAGARVVLEMPYGRFTYRVTRHAIVNPSSAGVLRAPHAGQRLVLTTCDPVFSDARRLVVFARLTDARR